MNVDGTYNAQTKFDNFGMNANGTNNGVTGGSHSVQDYLLSGKIAAMSQSTVANPFEQS